MYVIDDLGKRTVHVHQIQVAGSSDVEIVPPSDASYFGLIFSKDGDYVYYLRSEVKLPWPSLHRVPVLGGDTVQVVDHVDAAVAFSPDGRRFAFIRVYPESLILTTLTLFSLVTAALLIAQNNPSAEPKLSQEQQKKFLLHAKVINSRQTSMGITSPWRLTLADGTLTHDAVFQTIDEHKAIFQGADGRTELNFKDSYHFDIAGYEVAKLIGLDNMVPVYVERKWNGSYGAIGWWIPGLNKLPPLEWDL